MPGALPMTDESTSALTSQARVRSRGNRKIMPTVSVLAAMMILMAVVARVAAAQMALGAPDSGGTRDLTTTGARAEAWQDCRATWVPDRAVAGCTQLLDEAIARNSPATERASIHLLRGLARAGQFDGNSALADFDEAARLDPENAAAQVERGRWLETKDRIEEAFAAYDAAIRINPSSAAAHHRRGSALIARKADFTGGMAEFDTAIRLDPAYAAAHISRGLLFERLGDRGRAMAELDEGIRLAPSVADYYGFRASYHAKRGDLSLALTDLGEELRLSPRKAYVHHKRGRILEQAAELDGALQEFEAATRIEPSLVRAHIARGSVLERRGESARALEAYGAAIRDAQTYGSLIFIPDKVAHLRRAHLLEAGGNLAQALIDYEAALAANPRWQEASAGRDRVRSALENP